MSSFFKYHFATTCILCYLTMYYLILYYLNLSCAFTLQKIAILQELKLLVNIFFLLIKKITQLKKLKTN